MGGPAQIGEPRRVPLAILRAALAIGFAIDGFVALLALFAPAAMGPLLDVPVRDPAAATFAGGEFLVVAVLYAAIFRAPRRYRNLLWLVALDQTLAIILPLYEMQRGNLVATWKTVAPLGLSALLVVAYIAGWRSLNARYPQSQDT